MPPLPRNYTPGQGGGIGRARIREAPFGAAPLDTATRPQPGADQAAAAASGQPAAQAPRQPWYQVVGGPPAARRAGQAGQDRRAWRAGPALAAARNGVSAQAGAGRGAPTAAPSQPRALLPFAPPHPHSHP